nr:MAG TPA: hypothetical protein [Bacteriophage sp.]
MIINNIYTTFFYIKISIIYILLSLFQSIIIYANIFLCLYSLLLSNI